MLSQSCPCCNQIIWTFVHFSFKCSNVVHLHTRLCPDLCTITCVFPHVPMWIGSVILATTAVTQAHSEVPAGALGRVLFFLTDWPPVMGLPRDRALCSATEYIIVKILPFLHASKWQFESLLWLLEFHALLFTLCMGNLCTATCNNSCLPLTHNTRAHSIPSQLVTQFCQCEE